MSTMRDDQIEAEIELHMAVLRGPGPQVAYDRARQALLILRESLSRKSPDSGYRFNLDVPK
jgi:hypothetical protein